MGDISAWSSKTASCPSALLAVHTLAYSGTPLLHVVQQMQQSWMAQGMAAPISGMPTMAAMTGTQLPSTPQPLNMSGGVVPNGAEEVSTAT